MRNILDFPELHPGTRTVVLAENYRSTPELLEATNRVIAQARERHPKDLWSRRPSGERAELITCADEAEQTEFVLGRILERREQGMDLRRQAVLFRASHHSLQLEVELGRRGIPFHKYGGLRFVETAHVRDLLAFLRLAENPRDLLAGTRVLGLLPGVGPRTARALIDPVQQSGSFEGWDAAAKVPAAARAHWQALVALYRELGGPHPPALPVQLHRIRTFYGPLCEERYDHVDGAPPRSRSRWSSSPPGSPTAPPSWASSPSSRPARRRTSPARRRSTTTTWSSAPSTRPRGWSSTRSTCSTPPTGTSPRT